MRAIYPLQNYDCDEASSNGKYAEKIVVGAEENSALMALTVASSKCNSHTTSVSTLVKV